MIGDNVFKMKFEPNVPRAKILKEEFIFHKDEISFFMMIFLPKRSTYHKNGLRQDAERGILIFRKQNYVFFLHTHIKPRMFSNDLPDFTEDEKLLQLKESLIELKDRIKFHI
ncbi:hypothetical protein P3G55_07750 [Leptospira sp. 96542]|nr:hypothetical protein [Leptospira sp. 96542]